MTTFIQEYKLENKDVNLYRKLRTSRLFEMLQSVSVSHTEQLGAGKAVTLDHGILWVVVQQAVVITRMPEYEEHIFIKTWPGKTMHVLFPRYYQVEDQQGNVLIKASALWTLIDANTRRMVFADQYNVEIFGDDQPNQLPLPKRIKQEETTQHSTFTVPYSYCDLNGHMNNARYFDLAEDTIPYAYQGNNLSYIQTQYSQEIRCHQTIDIHWGHHNNCCFIEGTNHQNCFRIELTYTNSLTD